MSGIHTASKSKTRLVSHPAILRCSACPFHSTGVLCKTTQEQLNGLDRNKVCNTYAKGQTIFYEGNNPLGLYCLQSGCVKLYKSSPAGKQQIVRIVRAGELLGYRSLLAGERYSATAEALEPSCICFFGREVFLSLIQHSPTLSIRLLEKVCREFGQAEQYLFDMIHKTAQARIAQLLLALKERFETSTPAGPQIALDLPRSDIAAWAGTTTETAIRVLSFLRKRGILLIQDRRITVRNMPALMAISRSGLDGFH